MNNRIYQLAWDRYRETQCHDKDPAKDEMFLAYLMGQERPQTFRYLRAVADPSAPSYLAMVDQLEARLRTLAKVGISRKDASAELVALGNQARDLETAFMAFKKELENDRGAGASEGAPTSGDDRSAGKGSEHQPADAKGASRGPRDAKPDHPGDDKGRVRRRGRGRVAEGASTDGVTS